MVAAALLIGGLLALSPASLVSSQFLFRQDARPLFGPPPHVQCQCIHVHFCPAALITMRSDRCIGPDQVCCAVTASGAGCGRPARPDSGPLWTVAVTRRDQDGLLYRCAGALLSGGHVITVAHCVSSVSTEELVVAANVHDLLEDLNEEVFSNVEEVFIHPYYFAGNQRHDLAVLRLAARLGSDRQSTVRSVCLPETSTVSTSPGVTTASGGQDLCWASGWGKDVVRYDAPAAPLVDIPVTVTSGGGCQRASASVRILSELCLTAGPGRDLCQLDPGSPVVCRAGDGSATLLGVVSWARRCAGRRRSPLIVAAAVAPHLDWISGVLES